MSRHTYRTKRKVCPGECCTCLTNQAVQAGLRRLDEPILQSLGKGSSFFFLTPVWFWREEYWPRDA